MYNVVKFPDTVVVARDVRGQTRLLCIAGIIICCCVWMGERGHGHKCQHWHHTRRNVEKHTILYSFTYFQSFVFRFLLCVASFTTRCIELLTVAGIIRVGLVFGGLKTGSAVDFFPDPG